MAFMEWNERELGVHDVLMDAHHRELVAIINDLHAAISAERGREALAGSIARLNDYARFHFAAEEALLARLAYPDLVAQQQAHAEFNQQVAKMLTPAFAAQPRSTLDLITFLRDWLLTYIGGMDRAYGVWLAAQARS